MKVTVSFGDMRIIVPCGDGDLRISELMERATDRYKKATQKGEHCIVQVKYLETVKEHARLDVDDQVSDVCDDKDMLLAIYNENDKHVKIDDVVQVRDETSTDKYVTSALSDNDSGVAADAFGLRASSERASLDSASKPPRGPTHRRHAKSKNSSSISSSSPGSSPEVTAKHLLKVNEFTRDSTRKSLSSNHPILYKWFDQQESNFMTNDNSQEETDSDKSIEGEEIRLDQDSMQSIDIQPYTNADGVEIGLIVQGIAAGGESDYIGELQVADRITEVNGVSLLGLSNEVALDIFNNALKSGEVTAKRTHSHSFLKESSVESLVVPKQPDVVNKLTPKVSVNAAVDDVKEIKESAVEAPLIHREQQSNNVFEVNLTKGAKGLGFTVTSKDVITSKTTQIFIKNILRDGAAFADGRMQTGDQLLTVNGVAVSGKTQGDVVKLLRESEGAVFMKLSRPHGNVPPPIAANPVNTETPETLETFPVSKRPTLSPLLKAAVTSHIKALPNISPLAKQSSVPTISPLAKQSSVPTTSPVVKQSSELSSVNKGLRQSYLQGDEKNSLSSGIKESTFQSTQHIGKRGVLDDAPLLHTTKYIGKRGLLDGDVPVSKGGINLTIPLTIQENVGLGISVKGKIVKETSEEKGIFVKSIVPGTTAEKDGRVLVGDQLLAINNVSLKGLSNSAAMTLLKNTLAESVKEGVIRINVNRFVQTTSDSTDNDSVQSQSSHTSSTGCNQSKTKVDSKTNNNEKDHSINRTTSYFKAINRIQSPKSLESSSKPLFFQPDTSAQISKVTHEHPVNGQLWGTDSREKDIPLPTYEQALHYREAQSLAGTVATQSSVRFSQVEGHEGKNTFAKSNSITSSQAEGVRGMERGLSTISQCSLDSVLSESQRIAFTRDGPGRLSMSEKKGRGQIDATKSNFYNKLKKFKSMEELRAPEMLGNQDKYNDELRRTSSIDTIASNRLDDSEINVSPLTRGTVYSASTPFFGNELQVRHTEQRTPDRRDRVDNFESKLHHAVSSPTFPTKKRESPDEKKKKGFLNSIGIFLKRTKKRKDEEVGQGHSPEYIVHPDKFPFDRKALLEVYEDVENNNKNIPEQSKFLQADRLQMKLVEEKISEMQMRERKDKNKKLDTNIQKGNVPRIDVPTKGSDERPNIPLTGYQTWQAHDPKNMREKSKQFFTRELTNSLQRQHSLPPKNSVEVHRVLPRAPSGPMYKSADHSKLDSEYSSPPSSSKSRQPVECRDVYKKIDKAPQLRTPGVIKFNSESVNHKMTESGKHSELNPTDEKKHSQVTFRVRRQPSIENRNGNPGNPPPGNPANHDPKTTLNRRSMPSISDLKLRSSVTISHQAEI